MNHPGKRQPDRHRFFRQPAANVALQRLWLLGLGALLLLSLALLSWVIPVSPLAVAQAQSAGRLAVVGVQGAGLHDVPNGALMAWLAAGSTLTAVGRTADSQWLAVQTDSGHHGWATTQSLVIFGIDQLPVVDATAPVTPVNTQVVEARKTALPTTSPTPVAPTLAATPTAVPP